MPLALRKDDLRRFDSCPEFRPLVRAVQDKYRFDAGESAAIVRQLLYIQTVTYDVQYPDLKGVKFVPVASDTPSGADSVAYRQWDKFGQARVISNWADDLPRAEAQVKEFINPVKSIGAAFGYTIQDLRRAAMSGMPIDAMRAIAARRMIEEGLDYVIAFGDAASNLVGFLNNANCVIDAATGAWSGLTPQQIVADLNAPVTNMVTTTNEIEAPDSILLPTASYLYIAQTPFSPTGASDLTILKYFLQNNPWIKNVESWYRLNTAGAGGVKRSVTYKRERRVLEAQIPQPFEQFPPEARNLEFVVNCHARSGGVIMHYPKSVRFQDGM